MRTNVGVWTDFQVFLLIVLPCVVLFALALAPGSQAMGSARAGRVASPPGKPPCLLVGIPLLAGQHLVADQVIRQRRSGHRHFHLGARPDWYLRLRD